MEQIRSITFQAMPDNFSLFSVGWFAYPGLALSDRSILRGTGRTATWRGLVWKTSLNVVGMQLYVYTNGQGSVRHNGEKVLWFLKYLYHLDDLVLPFLAAFAVAFSVDEELREY